MQFSYLGATLLHVDLFSLLLRVQAHCNHAGVDNKHLCLGVEALLSPQNG